MNKPTQIKLAVITSVLTVILSVVVSLGVAGYMTSDPDPDPVATHASPQPNNLAFLSTCTGVEITNDSLRIGYANCIGKVRGFVDAHNILVELNAMNPTPSSRINLWCNMPEDITDRQLIDIVYSWTHTYPERFDQLRSTYSGADAAVAVFVAALVAAHPCSGDSV